MHPNCGGEEERGSGQEGGEAPGKPISQVMSEPSKPAISTTKLFRSADHVVNDTGMRIANSIKSASGRCERGSVWAAARERGACWLAYAPDREGVQRVLFQKVPLWDAFRAKMNPARTVKRGRGKGRV